MTVLSLPYFKASYTLAKAAIEVLNISQFSGRYHVTDSGAFVVVNRPEVPSDFLNTLNEKIAFVCNEEIGELIDSGEEVDEKELREYYKNEFIGFVIFMDELMNTNYDSFVIEAI